MGDAVFDDLVIRRLRLLARAGEAWWRPSFDIHSPFFWKKCQRFETGEMEAFKGSTRIVLGFSCEVRKLQFDSSNSILRNAPRIQPLEIFALKMSNQVWVDAGTSALSAYVNRFAAVLPLMDLNLMRVAFFVSLELEAKEGLSTSPGPVVWVISSS